MSHVDETLRLNNIMYLADANIDRIQKYMFELAENEEKIPPGLYDQLAALRETYDLAASQLMELE